VKSIQNAGLNDANRVLVVNFDGVLTDQLKITQTGPNLEGSQYFNVSQIEFLSPEPDYANGVFRSLFSQHRANIRRYIQIRVKDFDLEELHKPNNRTHVWIPAGEKNWVQIELVDVKFVPSCYRLQRFTHNLRSWSLRGSNDAMLPLNQWTILDQRHEEREGQWDNLASFGCFVGAFRYFRFVMEGLGWNESLQLFLKHIDLYGYLISAV
jgi:hypothetical protein